MLCDTKTVTFQIWNILIRFCINTKHWKLNNLCITTLHLFNKYGMHCKISYYCIKFLPKRRKLLFGIKMLYFVIKICCAAVLGQGHIRIIFNLIFINLNGLSSCLPVLSLSDNENCSKIAKFETQISQLNKSFLKNYNTLILYSSNSFVIHFAYCIKNLKNN